MKRSIMFFTLALLLIGIPSAYAQTMEENIFSIKKQWAVIKYQTPDKSEQEKAIVPLIQRSIEVSKENPNKADPMIWHAILMCTKAGIHERISDLDGVKQARDLLLEAEKINSKAQNGTIYTTLGSIYYKVPSWPVGFADKEKAKQYLEKALKINPDGVDPNFFYGELLYQMKDYAKSKMVLEHGLKAKARLGLNIADEGRKQEIRELLLKLNKES